MARTDTSRWTSQSIIKVAIVAAAVGCLGPLAFAVVRSGTEPPARTRKVATVGQVSLNSSPAASQAQAAPAERSSGSASASSSPSTTIAGASAPTSTTLLAAVPTTTSTSLVPRGSGDPQVAVVTVVDADDGKTISLRQGQMLRVVLDGPSWQFAEPSDAKVLAPQGEPTYTQGENCAPLPGTHCGTMKAEFKALKTGAATVTALRAPCGEAFRCADEAAKYQLEVRVRT
jgi:hypothetical protein